MWAAWVLVGLAWGTTPALQGEVSAQWTVLPWSSQDGALGRRGDGTWQVSSGSAAVVLGPDGRWRAPGSETAVELLEPTEMPSCGDSTPPLGWAECDGQCVLRVAGVVPLDLVTLAGACADHAVGRLRSWAWWAQATPMGLAFEAHHVPISPWLTTGERDTPLGPVAALVVQTSPAHRAAARLTLKLPEDASLLDVGFGPEGAVVLVAMSTSGRLAVTDVKLPFDGELLR